VGTLFDTRERATILDRMARITPDRRPVWGRFTAPEMICHLTCALRQSLEELEAGPPAGPFRHPPLNWLIIHVIPWPKGKAKSPPEFLTGRPTTWDADLATLRTLITRFAERGPDAAWPPSKVFGRISGRSWGALHYKHLDHHLRQFGV
jgi:hypothetical protein